MRRGWRVEQRWCWMRSAAGEVLARDDAGAAGGVKVERAVVAGTDEKVSVAALGQIEGGDGLVLAAPDASPLDVGLDELSVMGVPGALAAGGVTTATITARRVVLAPTVVLVQPVRAADVDAAGQLDHARFGLGQGDLALFPEGTLEGAGRRDLALGAAGAPDRHACIV